MVISGDTSLETCYSALFCMELQHTATRKLTVWWSGMALLALSPPVRLVSQAFSARLLLSAFLNALINTPSQDTKQMTLQLYQLSSLQYSLSAYVEQLLITTCNDFEQETRPMNVLQR